MLHTGNGSLTIRVNSVAKAVLDVAQGAVSVNVKDYISSGSNTVQLQVTDSYGNSRVKIFSIIAHARTRYPDIETIVSIVSNLVITLIGVAGAWLVMQIGKHQELKTINAAVGELTTAAETTVQELNQTVVEGLKEVSADGKLTKDEIQHLGKLLLEGTMAKMSDAGINVLKAANVDINAIIVSAGEALIARIKQQKALAA